MNPQTGNLKIIGAIVEGVKETFHEDTEKFVVDGSPGDYDLVYSVSHVIDDYMIAHKLNWLNQFFHKT